MIAALAGGTGAAKFLRGLVRAVDPTRVTVIGNTGDDLDCWGLHVSPDLDTVTYALAGLLDPVKGWGVRDETFHCLQAMARLGHETWFQLGDRDLATHLHRTALLREGRSLSEATEALRRALGVPSRILPMSDDPVRTRIHTPDGWLAFQEFFVREKAKVEILEVSYDGAETARPGQGVLEAIQGAEAVIVCPSNPITSVGPILAVPGILEALRATRAQTLAITPIVGGAPVSGPAGRLMAVRGFPVSALGVAACYRGWLDVLVVDRQDAGLVSSLETMGVRAVAAETLMTDEEREVALARTVLAALGVAG